MVEDFSEEVAGREIGRRIRTVRATATRAEAAEKIGVHPNTLARYEGGRVPDAGFVIRFCDVYRINEAWLLTGREPKDRGGSFAQSLVEQAYGVAERAGTYQGPPDDWVMVPVYKIEAASGYGAYAAGEEEEHEPLAFPRLQLRRLASHAIDKLVVVFNRGDSNVPDIGDGDAMLVDRAVERIRDDAFYVVGNDDRLMVKLVEQLFDGRVALKSRNAQYREEILSRADAERLHVFGRVVWRGGLV